MKWLTLSCAILHVWHGVSLSVDECRPGDSCAAKPVGVSSSSLMQSFAMRDHKPAVSPNQVNHPSYPTNHDLDNLSKQAHPDGLGSNYPPDHTNDGWDPVLNQTFYYGNYDYFAYDGYYGEDWYNFKHQAHPDGDDIMEHYGDGGYYGEPYDEPYYYEDYGDDGYYGVHYDLYYFEHYGDGGYYDEPYYYEYYGDDGEPYYDLYSSYKASSLIAANIDINGSYGDGDADFEYYGDDGYYGVHYDLYYYEHYGDGGYYDEPYYYEPYGDDGYYGEPYDELDYYDASYSYDGDAAGYQEYENEKKEKIETNKQERLEKKEKKDKKRADNADLDDAAR